MGGINSSHQHNQSHPRTNQSNKNTNEIGYLAVVSSYVAMSGEISGVMDFLSKIATVGGFGATIATFAIIHRRTRKSEQYDIADKISRAFAENEHKIIEIPDEKKDELKAHYMQYLNLWEWFAPMVNNGELNEKNIIDHFKPRLLKQYEKTFAAYPDLKEDKHDYEQLKIRYDKWKDS